MAAYKIYKKGSSESALYLNCDTVLLPLEDQVQKSLYRFQGHVSQT
jgi:hypothetical protein